ncbi:MAG: hypothetical protein IPK16_01670 [Anaerolineales bacterium]|nr:hypothetical protein [Anaerolineales bacterium]
MTTENPTVMFHITISIDGIGALQDELRGPHQWERTLATWHGLHNLQQTHPNLHVSVQSTISQANAHTADELLRTCLPMSENYALAFASESEFYGNQGAGIAFARDRRSAIPIVTRLVEAYPVSIRHPATVLVKLFLLGELRRLSGADTGIRCAAGAATLTLKADGSVMTCLFRSGGAFANVRADGYDLPSLLASDKALVACHSAAQCSQCWINCEAIPSMLQSPFAALSLMGAKRRLTRQAEPEMVLSPQPRLTLHTVPIEVHSQKEGRS